MGVTADEITEGGPWTKAVNDLERIYASFEINFEGAVFYGQKCGAARTLNNQDEGNTKMLSGTEYKARSGFKVYYPANMLGIPD